jgi:hypothetical protein
MLTVIMSYTGKCTAFSVIANVAFDELSLHIRNVPVSNLGWGSIINSAMTESFYILTNSLLTDQSVIRRNTVWTVKYVFSEIKNIQPNTLAMFICFSSVRFLI